MLMVDVVGQPVLAPAGVSGASREAVKGTELVPRGGRQAI